MSVVAPGAVVRRRRQPDRGDLASEERCLLAVAERHPQIDELRKPAGPRRRPAELGCDPDVGGPDERRGGRAWREAGHLEPRPRRTGQGVERNHGAHGAP